MSLQRYFPDSLQGSLAQHSICYDPYTLFGSRQSHAQCKTCPAATIVLRSVKERLGMPVLLYVARWGFGDQ